MHYSQVLPSEKIRHWVRHFGILENTDPVDQPRTFHVVADTCPGLIFQEDPTCFLYGGNQQLPQLFLHGIATKHSTKRATGRFNNLVVCFKPHALRSLFGIDASELTNTYIDLNSIVKSQLTEQLSEVNDMAGRIELITHFLWQQDSWRKRSKTDSIVLAVDQLGKAVPLRVVQAQLGLSERSLERLVKTTIGVSPTVFSRISRFQQALNQLRSPCSSSFGEIAHACAYADQSHFIREFKLFTGVQPSSFRKYMHEQIVNFPEWRG